MTKLLDKIIKQISLLPDDEQDAIAGLLANELAWKESFVNSQEQLEMLAEEALNEFKVGKTKPLQF